ncbi:MAG: hypothetical protein WBO23_15925 [Burkholderiales bacterium]
MHQPALKFFFALSFACVVVSAQAQGPGGRLRPKTYPWDERPPKCFMPGAMEVAGSYCAPKDWTSYPATAYRVNQLLMARDFDLVQRAENELGYSREQFSPGEYLFDAWYSGLNGVFGHAGELSYELLGAWTKAKGEDGYVKVAEAMVRYGEGWNARGYGASGTVSPEAWNIYRRKLREADAILESAPGKVKKMGPWYRLKLTIAYQLPEFEGRRSDLLAAASKSWPDYVGIYATAMSFAMPKWGGDYQRVEEIALLAVGQSKARLGASLYPVLYQRMFGRACDCTVRDSAADWDLMKRGFRDIEARGQTDPDVWSAYARLACQMRDRNEARHLLQLSDKFQGPHGAQAPDPCREFAFSPT